MRNKFYFLALLVLLISGVLFISKPVNAMPIGTILYRTSRDGVMYGYNTNNLFSLLDFNFKDGVKTMKVNCGHVGMYVGKVNGEEMIIEAINNGIQLTPAKYFINTREKEKLVGAKIPKDVTFNEDAIARLADALAGKKLSYDWGFADQKGPGDSQFICVGLTEKFYESYNDRVDKKIFSTKNILDYFEYNPNNYGIDITPDGYENENIYNLDNGDSLATDKEYSRISQRGFEPAYLIGKLSEGKRYFFLPYTQFIQPTLKDVEVDIQLESDFDSEKIRGPQKMEKLIVVAMRNVIIEQPVETSMRYIPLVFNSTMALSQVAMGLFQEQLVHTWRVLAYLPEEIYDRKIQEIDKILTAVESQGFSIDPLQLFDLVSFFSPTKVLAASDFEEVADVKVAPVVKKPKRVKKVTTNHLVPAKTKASSSASIIVSSSPQILGVKINSTTATSSVIATPDLATTTLQLATTTSILTSSPIATSSSPAPVKHYPLRYGSGENIDESTTVSANELLPSQDNLAPLATMIKVPAENVGSKFEIFWQGNDIFSATATTSGIDFFDIDYAVTDSAESGSLLWENILSQTTATSTIFDKNYSFNSYLNFRVRATDNAGNIGGWSAVEKTKIVAATPDAITDLALASSSISINSAKLIWHSPAFANLSPNAKYLLNYVVKNSTCDSLATWENSYSMPAELLPLPALESNMDQEVEIAELESGTTYCAKVFTNNGFNISSSSNIVEFTTKNIPKPLIIGNTTNTFAWITRSLRFPHVVMPGDNRLLVVILFAGNNLIDPGMSYADLPMTLVSETPSVSGVGQIPRSYIFYLKNPPEGVGEIVYNGPAFNFSGLVGIDISNVDLDSLIVDSRATIFSWVTEFASEITVPREGSLAIEALSDAWSDSNFIPESGQNIFVNFNSSGVYDAINVAAAYATLKSGANSLAWNLSTGRYMENAIVSQNFLVIQPQY